jgi:hypothetical protein
MARLHHIARAIDRCVRILGSLPLSAREPFREFDECPAFLGVLNQQKSLDKATPFLRVAPGGTPKASMLPRIAGLTCTTSFHHDAAHLKISPSLNDSHRNGAPK